MSHEETPCSVSGHAHAVGASADLGFRAVPRLPDEGCSLVRPVLVNSKTMMKSSMTLPRLVVASLAGLTLLACEPSTGPDAEQGVPESELTFLRFSETAAPLADSVVSFWAVRGQSRRVEIDYRPEAGEDEGERFLRFEVDDESLLRYPDGRAFARGDSVRITVRVVDSQRFLFVFEPAGLTFNPAEPAELEVSYEHADRDFDDDGDEDEDDARVEREFAVWHQARRGGLWQKAGTLKIEDLEEVEAEILSFSRYALASN